MADMMAAAYPMFGKDVFSDSVMKERLKPEIVSAVNIDHIIAEQIKSKYDYRVYFKAK